MYLLVANSMFKAWAWVVGIGAIVLGIAYWWPAINFGAFVIAFQLMSFNNPGAKQTCPQCAEHVQAAAVVCKHCGYRFAD